MHCRTPECNSADNHYSPLLRLWPWLQGHHLELGYSNGSHSDCSLTVTTCEIGSNRVLYLLNKNKAFGCLIEENFSRMKKYLVLLTVVTRRHSDQKISLDLWTNIVKIKCQPTRLKEKLSEKPFVFLCFSVISNANSCTVGTLNAAWEQTLLLDIRKNKSLPHSWS